MVTRRRRQLSPEEKSLWEQVARTTQRLHAARPPDADPFVSPPPPAPVAAAPSPPPPPKPRPKKVAPTPPPPVAAPVRRRGPPAPEQLDRRTVHRLARGTIAIDGRIDLHGLTQAEAHDRLLGYLAVAQSTGGRMVLVITGKGAPDIGAERGVLRRAVPGWLSSPLFRIVVSGYEEAHRSHGGSGALYVRIRKAGP